MMQPLKAYSNSLTKVCCFISDHIYTYIANGTIQKLKVGDPAHLAEQEWEIIPSSAFKATGKLDKLKSPLMAPLNDTEFVLIGGSKIYIFNTSTDTGKLVTDKSTGDC